MATDRAYKVALVGGPDVDARIELMGALSDDFRLVAAGTEPALGPAFERAGFAYQTYPLARRINPMADGRALAALVWFFRRQRCHIVHTFDTKPCVLGRLAARIAGVPVVMGTLPGLGSLYVEGRVVTRTVRTAYEGLQALACRLSDLTIFQNPDDAGRFVSRGIVPAAKTRVIPGSGVRTELFNSATVPRGDRQRVRAELGIAPGAVVVLMVSRLIRSKGVAEFGAAAQLLREPNPEAQFLLAGGVDEQSRDRLTIEELSRIGREVIWAGPRRDIPGLMAAADIFVLPSFLPEGIPRVLLEAASMGLPMVTTDTPGCREVVEHEVNGLLVPPRDSGALARAIQRLAGEAEARGRFGEASQHRAVTRFDLGRIAGQLRSIYHGLLAQKGVPA